MKKLTAAGIPWGQPQKHEYQEALDEILRVGKHFGVTEVEAEAVLDEVIEAFTIEEKRRPTASEMVRGIRAAVREACGEEKARQIFGQ